MEKGRYSSGNRKGATLLQSGADESLEMNREICGQWVTHITPYTTITRHIPFRQMKSFLPQMTGKTLVLLFSLSRLQQCASYGFVRDLDNEITVYMATQ